MRRVIIESPYAGHVLRNQVYARLCCAHALALGDAPFASHLLYTQPGILDDDDPEERDVGITAGLIWGQVADATVAYIDLGISRGMRHGIADAQTYRRTLEIRSINYPVTLSWGKEPIEEALERAASAFGGGDAAKYYADQANIILECNHAAAGGPLFFGTAVREEIIRGRRRISEAREEIERGALPRGRRFRL